MATSGTTIWQANRNEIIESALRKLQVLSEEQSANSTQLAKGNLALNAMLKAFHSDGMPIWAIDEYTFTVVDGTATYNIGIGETLDTPQPLKVIQAYRTELNSSNVPLNIYTKYNYNLLPLNNNSGVPVNLYYQPLSTTGIIKLWPTPSDDTTTITIVYQRPFEDMTSSTDNLDFPAYWTEAVIYGLAWRLAPEYSVPLPDRQMIASEAKLFKDEALSFGSEEGSLYMQPDWNG